MDVQESTTSMAQTVAPALETQIELPKRRGKSLLFVGIGMGVLAIIAASVAVTMVLMNNSKSPSTTANQTAVSTPVTESEDTTTIEEQSNSNEELSFDIDLSAWGSNRLVNVKLTVPEGTSLKKEVKSHELGYTLTNGANSMYVFLPYESFPTPYSSFEKVGTNTQFGTISRYTIAAEVHRDTFFYTSNQNLNGVCTQDMYGYDEPCGERFIGTAEGESIFVSCPVSSKEFCDTAVVSIKVATTTQQTTKDLSLEIDFSEWMSSTVKTIEVKNVPIAASATFVSEQGNRVKGYRIQDASFSLFVYYPYESGSAQVFSKEGNIPNEQFGTIRRVAFKDDPSTLYYVSDSNIFNCQDVAMVDWTGECAGFYMKAGTSSTAETAFAICSNGFEVCDRIIESLKVSSREE